TVSFNLRAPFALNGGDDVAALLLFYLMISPCGRAWSIDSFRRRMKTYRDPEEGFESPAPRPVPPPVSIDAWPVRLMQIQLVCIYFFNGISKLNFADGFNHYFTGEAVYWALNDITLTRFSYAAWPTPLWLCAVLSWATILFELSFPFLVLFARLRPWVLFIGVLFHLGIFITMELGWFGQVMLCFYPILLRGESVATFAAWLAGKRSHSPAYILYYDTFCPVCRRSRFAMEIFDVGKRIEFRDIHDRELMQRDLPGVTYAQSLKEMMVVSPGGKLTRGFDAFRTAMRVLPALWLILPLLYLPGVSHLGRRVYRWVAKNRFRLVKCDVGVCNMHLRALSNETLDEEE
ncbi:MAG: DCC1-like thiol-disulfide oxidoreductase family protein, partial [Phycisphaeraceae bacterium]